MNTSKPLKQTHFIKMSALAIMTMSIGLTGCQSLGGLFGNDKPKAVLTAEESAAGYYQKALKEIKDDNLTLAADSLNNLRTFYPTSPYASQALLDLMYVQFILGEYQPAVSSAETFMRLHPTHPQLDYAHYVRGVANMQTATGKTNLFNIDVAKRDTAPYRLAFGNFAELINKFPNSKYAPDAAKRMTYIYNQLAEHEMNVARWYVEREAYLAAARRAKWVFQYFPQSTSVPESIATLAYTNKKLGLNDLSNQYTELLKINYPNWLNAKGEIDISKANTNDWLKTISFGKLTQVSEKIEDDTNNYQGTTKTQLIRNAGQLRLPTAK